MINAQPTQARLARARRCGGALAVLALVLAGCSTSGGKKLTSAELSKAMPTAQDFGTDFRRVKVDDSSDDSTLKISKKCKTLLTNDDKGKQHAKREFKDTPEREIDVSATDTDTDLATLENTVKSCSKIPFSSGSTTGLITFKLTKSDVVGDKADALDLTLTVTKPISLTIHGHGILSKRGNIGMSVLGLDGIDAQAKVTPIDNALIDKAARQLDQKVKAAQG